MRNLTAVVATSILSGGCGGPKGAPGWDYPGSYMQNLASEDLEEVDLEATVTVDKKPSLVCVKLFEGEDGLPHGFMGLDGDIQIAIAFDVFDFGTSNYPIKGLEIHGLSVKGVADIEDNVNISLEGMFSGDFQELRGVARAQLGVKPKLGEITLHRLEEETKEDSCFPKEPEEDPATKGITTDPEPGHSGATGDTGDTGGP